VGIVLHNAIALVDVMNAYRKEGMNIKHAAAAGVSDRLRPIITSGGLIPLALSAPTWLPLSAIIFGLMAATLIALLITPCLYLLVTPSHD